MTEAINLESKLAKFSALWEPKLIGQLNGQHVKLAKLKGEFVWHSHENEGELIIVPRGVEHCPKADEEAHVLLFEPAETCNTGSTGGPRTVEVVEWL